MSYHFEAGRIYRMPTHFGPAPGPRQMPDGIADPKHSPRRLSVAASFLTDRAQLERHLPAGFEVAGEPVVTIEVHYWTEIDWLAGRGYNLVTVSWPASFVGQQDRVTGRFLAVVWENLADAIIAGRDETGWPKLYADIAEPRLWESARICSAEWRGFRFLDLSVCELRVVSPPAPTVPLDGTLMLKYVPRTGAWGEADLQQVTFSPMHDPDKTIERYETGTARVRFHHATWSDLPTMHHIVNALAALPIIESRGGSVTRSHGGKTFHDQRVLR